MPRLPSTGSFWEGPQHSRTQPATHNSQEERKKEERKRGRGRERGGERERESESEHSGRMRSSYTFCQAEGMAGTSYWEARSISIDFSRFLHLSLVCRGPWRRKTSGAHFKGIEKNLFPDLQRTCSTCTRSSLPQHLQTHPRLPVVPAGTAPPAGDVHHPHTRPG